MSQPKNFIGRFDHYCGRVRALYSLRDGGHSATDWFADEASARAAVPNDAVVDSRGRFIPEQAA